MKVRIHVILRRLSLKSVQILHFTHTYFLNTKPFKNQILFSQLIPTHGPLLRSVIKKERIAKLQNFTNPPPSPTTAKLITIRSSETNAVNSYGSLANLTSSVNNINIIRQQWSHFHLLNPSTKKLEMQR